MQETIRLKDVLRLMDATDEQGKAVPFSITFYTADIERNTGGERIKIDQQIVTKNRQMGARAQEPAINVASRVSKNPNHGVHFTRNLVIPGWEHMVKVHPRLITHFNNKRVVW